MAVELPVIGELKAHALAYASDGLEVFPVNPRDKTPLVSQYKATTDAATIEAWWTRWPDALIGHRFAEDQIALDIDPRHGGRDTWQALVDAGLIDASIATRSHYSGRNDGGGHLWFKRPEGRLTITKIDEWARERGTGHGIDNTDRWVGGLDLLHRMHRYTILPPSPHPDTKQPYKWRMYGEVLEMPAELAALLQDTAPPPKPFEPKPYDGDSIADWYSASASWTQLLPIHGWTLRAGSGDDDGSQWRHPGATSPISATVRHECLFVYSPNTPFEVTAPGDAHGVTRFRAFTILDHRGDASAAARAARELKDGPPMTRVSPPPADFAPPPPRIDEETGEIVTMVSDEEPETAPTEAVRVHWADDEADPPAPIDELVTNLVARGEFTVLGAPRAMGKTWATMQLAGAAADGHGHLFGSPLLSVTQPQTVMYLQGELGRGSSYARWRLATNGRPPHVAEVFDRLRVRVTTTRTTSTVEGVTTTDEYSHALIDHRLEPLLEQLGVDLLIVDPWATYYSGNENSNDEVEAAIDAMTQMLRRVGAAGWIVHHISAKATHGNLAEPEDLWRGASRLPDAVATRVTLLPHYTPTKAKELGMDRFQARRFGDLHILQRNGPPVPVIHTQLEGFTWTGWDPPNTDGGRPEELHQRDLIGALREAGGAIDSKRKLVAACGKSNTAVDRVLLQCMHNGYVEEFTGPRNSIGYRLVEGVEID